VVILADGVVDPEALPEAEIDCISELEGASDIDGYVVTEGLPDCEFVDELDEDAITVRVYRGELVGTIESDGISELVDNTEAD